MPLKEEYRERIRAIIDRIESEDVLMKIYTFAKTHEQILQKKKRKTEYCILF